MHEVTEWWNVNLKKIVEIDQIVLHLMESFIPREFYEGAQISTRVHEGEQWSSCADIPTNSDIVKIKCNNMTIAQFVKVSVPRNNKPRLQLVLYEVKVFGKPVKGIY